MQDATRGHAETVLGELVAPRKPAKLIAVLRWAQKNPLGALGFLLVLTLVLLAATAGIFATHDPRDLTAPINLGPSRAHYLGTDNVGRDIFTRVLYGARLSLYVGLGAVFLGVTAGALFGLVSGYLGGLMDLLGQRLVDALIAFPVIIKALVIMAILGPGATNVVIALSVGMVALASRVTRSVVLREKERVYVDAARAMGASSTRIMLRHVLPNSIAPYFVLVSVQIGSAIVAEATLSFLGAGVSPETSSWGNMLATSAASYFDSAPTLALAPGLAITAAVLGFNLFGDAIRDTLDPRLRAR